MLLAALMGSMEGREAFLGVGESRKIDITDVDSLHDKDEHEFGSRPLPLQITLLPKWMQAPSYRRDSFRPPSLPKGYSCIGVGRLPAQARRDAGATCLAWSHALSSQRLPEIASTHGQSS